MSKDMLGFSSRRRKSRASPTGPSSPELPSSELAGANTEADPYADSAENGRQALDILHRVAEAQQVFLAQAVERGLTDEEIEQAVRDAINGGVLPRIVDAAFQWKGGQGKQFATLHGSEIPAQYLDVSVHRYPDRPAHLSVTQALLQDGVPSEPTEGDPTGFYTKEHTLPGLGQYAKNLSRETWQKMLDDMIESSKNHN